MNMCTECKHRYVSYRDNPCSECVIHMGYIKFEPKQEVGYIVKLIDKHGM